MQNQKNKNNKVLLIGLLFFWALRSFSLKMPAGGGGVIPGGGSGNAVSIQNHKVKNSVVFVDQNGNPIKINMVDPFLVTNPEDAFFAFFDVNGSQGAAGGTLHKILGFSEDQNIVLMDFGNNPGSPLLFRWPQIKNLITYV